MPEMFDSSSAISSPPGYFEPSGSNLNGPAWMHKSRGSSNQDTMGWLLDREKMMWPLFLLNAHN
jgi:hypothetical protein